MQRCYCGCVAAILVIIFAWVDVSWAKYVLTVLGVILALKALAGDPCCCSSKGDKTKTDSSCGTDD